MGPVPLLPCPASPEEWIARAEASGIKMLKSFAKTLREHQAGILAYYNFRISTGPL
ncbi:MAG: transposase, partial [Isosphaeraceae bacterium]